MLPSIDEMDAAQEGVSRMTRTVLARFPTYDLAKQYEADLINEGKYRAKQLQVRRRSDGFAVVLREAK